MLRLSGIYNWVCDCEYLNRRVNLHIAFAKNLEAAITYWPKDGYHVDIHAGAFVSTLFNN